ncbi:collagen alpha-1(I) chain-like [Corvus cornix cornix]|uniref:collagen alpha-1(I) chain-like n=1 Tax=Corvus cornix cornix TaxID=932674 RepID=UPI00194F6D8B|nr:collagen alpha-1(I) chain-like [Corvus cornix cornix]
MLCVPSGIWPTLCPNTVTWDGAGMGLGCSAFPTGMGKHRAPAWCHLCSSLCRDGAGMLHVPNWNRGTQHRASCALSPAARQCSVFPAGTGDAAPQGRAACTPSPRRAGVLRIPAGPLCPGWCPRSVCNQPRSRVRPGPVPAPAWKRGSGSRRSQSRGAQPGERPRRGSGEAARCWGRDSPGDAGTRPRHGPAAPAPAPRRSGLCSQAGPAAGGGGRWSRRPESLGEGLRQPDSGPGTTGVRHHVPAAEPAAVDHQTVLPDYGRIPALSGGPGRAVPGISGLKEQLGRLSDRFAHLEAFRGTAEARARSAAAPAAAGEGSSRAPAGSRDPAVSDPRPHRGGGGGRG